MSVYGDSVDNAVDENSSVFSLICMRWLPSARTCGQTKLCRYKILQFLTGGAVVLTHVDLYNGRKTVFVGY